MATRRESTATRRESQPSRRQLTSTGFSMRSLSTECDIADPDSPRRQFHWGMTTFPELPMDRVFTRSEARAGGVSDQRIAAAVAAGRLRRPWRGVFVPAELPDSLELRVQCLAKVMPDGCFAADHTAGWLMCGDVILPPNGHLAIPQVAFFRPAEGGRLRNSLCRSGERSLLAGELFEIGGVPCTTSLRTAWDLGRLQQRDVALAGMDQLMRAGGFDLDELCAGVERFRGERGVVQLRCLAPRVDPGAESFGESALRNRWHDAGLPRPVTQIPILLDGREIYRLDLGDPTLRYAAEYQGADFHTEQDQYRDEERRRWVESHRGYAIEEFGRRRVFGPHQDADLVLRRGWQNAVVSLARRRRLFVS